MTEAQKILSMIESVSPDDTAKLDEIDARVWCYLNNRDIFLHYAIKDHPPLFYFRDDTKPWGKTYIPDYLHDENWQYTRSRDALKAIRPDGFFIASIQENIDGEGWTCSLDNEDKSFWSPYSKTEELAELHAIIQAIEYERGEK